MEGFVDQLWTALSDAGAPAIQNMLAQREAAAAESFAEPDDEPSPEGSLPPDEDLRATDNGPEAEGPPSGR